jgi:hypothetical protein
MQAVSWHAISLPYEDKALMSSTLPLDGGDSVLVLGEALLTEQSYAHYFSL